MSNDSLVRVSRQTSSRENAERMSEALSFLGVFNLQNEILQSQSGESGAEVDTFEVSGYIYADVIAKRTELRGES